MLIGNIQCAGKHLNSDPCIQSLDMGVGLGKPRIWNSLLRFSSFLWTKPKAQHSTQQFFRVLQTSIYDKYKFCNLEHQISWWHTLMQF